MNKESLHSIGLYLIVEPKSPLWRDVVDIIAYPVVVSLALFTYFMRHHMQAILYVDIEI
jgi:hypothetical protein